MKSDTTKLSSKGQIVVPKICRIDLGWGDGDTLVVAKYENMLVLKKVDDKLDEEEIKRNIKREHESFKEERKNDKESINEEVKSMHRSYIC